MCNRVLVGRPQQRLHVGDDRMMDDALLLGDFDALEPVGKSLRDILLPESLPFDEPDLYDDLGTNPVSVTGQARAFRERRLLDGESVETCSQIEQALRVEPRADLAGECEVVALVLRLGLRIPRA